MSWVRCQVPSHTNPKEEISVGWGSLRKWTNWPWPEAAPQQRETRIILYALCGGEDEVARPKMGSPNWVSAAFSADNKPRKSG